jgi:hypothetical protein
MECIYPALMTVASIFVEVLHPEQAPVDLEYSCLLDIIKTSNGQAVQSLLYLGTRISDYSIRTVCFIATEDLIRSPRFISEFISSRLVSKNVEIKIYKTVIKPWF